MLSGDKGFDERSLGAFDTHYDTDSAWDFGSGPTKVYEHFLMCGVLCSVHCIDLFSAGLHALIGCYYCLSPHSI